MRSYTCRVSDHVQWGHRRSIVRARAAIASMSCSGHVILAHAITGELVRAAHEDDSAVREQERAHDVAEGAACGYEEHGCCVEAGGAQGEHGGCRWAAVDHWGSLGEISIFPRFDQNSLHYHSIWGCTVRTSWLDSGNSNLETSVRPWTDVFS